MKLAAIAFLIVSLGASFADPLKTEVGPLTDVELQKLLGITSVRVDVPESFGDYIDVRVNVYHGDKLKITLGGGSAVPTDRKLAIAIQDQESGFAVTEISEHGLHPLMIPRRYFEPFEGKGAYSEASTPLAEKDGQTLIYKKEFFRAKLAADGHSYSTDNPENKKLGRCIVFIERYEPAKSEEEEGASPE